MHKFPHMLLRLRWILHNGYCAYASYEKEENYIQYNILYKFPDKLECIQIFQSNLVLYCSLHPFFAPETDRKYMNVALPVVNTQLETPYFVPYRYSLVKKKKQ